jgi:hypothetical protein
MSKSYTAMILCYLLVCGFLIGLKLVGFLTWPWSGVTAPVWVPAAIALIVFGLAWVSKLIDGAKDDD